MTVNMEREITEPVLLCDKSGNLNYDSVGWAKKPIITANLSGHFLRKKKWNYWCVFSREALLSATISHLDYAAVCFIYYLEYETKEFHEKTFIIPFNKDIQMPEEILDSVNAMSKDTGIFFIWNNDYMNLKIHCTDFGGAELKADINIHYPEDMETLNVIVPWSDKQFQFTAKHHCLPADGSFSIGTKTFSCNPETDFGVLDFGRGIWPRKSTWNWGMASGRQGNDVIGLNFGGKWTDGTGSTENAAVRNGVITKISEDVDFIYNRHDLMQPWSIQSNQVRLTFEPFYKRTSAFNALAIKSNMYQIVGHFYGEITLRHDDTLVIDKLLGCIEDHTATW
ncbi:DUF2804 domain-containing protein [Virgibacillus siamensis]|uniref:DUF2804 domain-containing protein n=1 Tax=Virgibacillus siamensis TaxID=480071 RepID=UPI0009865E4F|nr:DUF2804 domain-containing protein [Virgibacillus siamensis]